MIHAIFLFSLLQISLDKHPISLLVSNHFYTFLANTDSLGNHSTSHTSTHRASQISSQILGIPSKYHNKIAVKPERLTFWTNPILNH